MFQNSVLKSVRQDESLVALRWAKFQGFRAKTEDIRSFKEEEYQDKFLSDIFEDCLGYTLKTTNPQAYNLSREKKNETDSKKADGALHVKGEVVGVIELKDQKTKNLDTVQTQAFNYHNSHAHSRYIIISNFDELRFYIDKKTEFEKFSLFSLTYEDFQKLHLLLSFESIKNDLPLRLKEKSSQHEKDISDKLYKDFSDFRNYLFKNIVKNNEQDKNLLLRLTQKLCDRIIFILFAEDRGLLRANTIQTIREDFANQKFSAFTLYDIYKFYFNGINQGDKKLQILKYNGGLFAEDKTLNSLIIDDEILDEKVQKLSDYDFQSDISVNILGHIFEQSLTDLEQMNANINQTNFDEKKSKRKKDGVFYTPEYITKYIVQNTLGKLCENKKEELGILHVSPPKNSKRPTKKEQSVKDSLQIYKLWLFDLKILDPTCGSGAFLNQALDFLIHEHEELQKSIATMGDVTAYYQIEKPILENNLYGVDINEDATEIAKLSLWLRTASKGRELTKLADKIKCGNSLIDDKKVAKNAFIWEEEFPEVFANGGFDVVIGNPPYGAKLNKEIQKYLNDKYIKGASETSIAFIKLSYDKLLIQGNPLGFIVPKSFSFSSNYSSIREYLLSDIYEIVDCKKVWQEVKLEQIMLFFRKKYPNEKYISGVLKNSEVFKLGEIAKTTFKEFGFYLNGITDKKLKLAQKAKTDCLHVKDIATNSRGGIFQKKLTDVGDIAVLGGAEIQRYGIIGIKGYVDKNIIKHDTKSFIDENSILVQNIVAHIENPIDHIKITACYPENRQFAIVDTINQITFDKKYNAKVFWLLFNSKFINWYSYRFILAKAIRTIHFDSPITNRIPIPKTINQQPFIQKANQMLELNKSLHVSKKAFLNELDLEKIPKKLQDFEKLSFDEFIIEYKKAKKLKFKNKLEERNFKNNWIDIFTHDKKEAQILQEKIQKTDNEIDKMVYDLYDLTDEEIAIVEGGIAKY